ncbi:compound eye opsin BCRH1 [Eurytemora carolleeae]|uniref:compound eye opsin BCRH1 n=1 Tax=Eurytemora carolleeae TaxID=1294199 RepID=UPI000C78F575|nr:compound eye opsin BCRH1 [Eurytemora carolleeae]|eukprot:XP_023345332.1 compound eye opsin BCRH1-like [Eurytemora affinis]
MILSVWVYSILSTLGPFIGWGSYALEGFLVTCSYDYLKEDLNSKSFILYTLVTHFFLPMAFVIFFYLQIARAVICHEKAMQKQAKKMNIYSLRTKEEDQSIEVKIAKVSITNVLLWIGTWGPYAIVVLIGLIGQHQIITPLFSGLPGLLAKTNSSLNPLVFAISHPKYREAMAAEIPCIVTEDTDDVEKKREEDKTACTNA